MSDAVAVYSVLRPFAKLTSQQLIVMGMLIRLWLNRLGCWVWEPVVVETGSQLERFHWSVKCVFAPSMRLLECPFLRNHPLLPENSLRLSHFYS